MFQTFVRVRHVTGPAVLDDTYCRGRGTLRQQSVRGLLRGPCQSHLQGTWHQLRTATRQRRQVWREDEQRHVERNGRRANQKGQISLKE